MKLLTKLFGSPREKQVFDKRDKFHKNSNAIRQIGEAIITAAEDCYTKTLPLIIFAEEQEKQSASIHVYYEYLYFFRHLVLRSAFGQLSFLQVKSLHEYIAGTVVPHALDTFLKLWPEEIRPEMRSDFFAKLNDVEATYGNSEEIFSPKDPCNSDALTSIIARNIAALAGNSNHPTTIRTVIVVMADAYKAMKLEKLIQKAKEDIYVKHE